GIIKQPDPTRTMTYVSGQARAETPAASAGRGATGGGSAGRGAAPAAAAAPVARGGGGGDDEGGGGGLNVQGLPLVKPPYGRITAIDLNKGDIVWQIAHGD